MQFLYASAGIAQNHSLNTTIKNCSFGFNTIGCIDGTNTMVDSCLFANNIDGGIVKLQNSTISNTSFLNNGLGIAGESGCRYTNCTINSNSNGFNNLSYSLMTNCVLKYNLRGITSAEHSTIRNTMIDSNTLYGLLIGDKDTVTGCQISNNGIGLVIGESSIIYENTIEHDSIGIEVDNHTCSIYCNYICNSTAYDLYYNVEFYNYSMPNNYWCTLDSGALSAKIFDGYDNISRGLVSIMPIDTFQCTLSTNIEANGIQEFMINLYPNPANNFVSVLVDETLLGSNLTITDITGREVLHSAVQIRNPQFDIRNLSSGVYFVTLENKAERVTRKLVKQ